MERKAMLAQKRDELIGAVEVFKGKRDAVVAALDALHATKESAAVEAALHEQHLAIAVVETLRGQVRTIAGEILMETGEERPVEGVELRVRWVPTLPDYDQARAWAKRNAPHYVYEQLDAQGMLAEMPDGAPIVLKDELEFRLPCLEGDPLPEGDEKPGLSGRIEG
jgi:hypothetical protein